MTAISANGITLEYEAIGDASAPPILLIMGLGAQLTLWPDDFCTGLANAGFRVVRYDNRDVGLSSRVGKRPPHLLWQSIRFGLGLRVKAPYTLDDMALDALGLMDALGIGSAHVVGVSMGGMIAQILGARHGARVRSLTLMMASSGDRKLPHASRKVRSKFFFGRPRSRDPEVVLEHLVGLWQLIGSPGYPRTEAELRDMTRRQIERSYDPAGVVRQTTAVMASGSLAPSIAAPTLVVHGTDDPLVPVAHGHDLAARIAGAKLELIEGMGHDLPPALVPRLTELVRSHVQGVEAPAAA